MRQLQETLHSFLRNSPLLKSENRELRAEFQTARPFLQIYEHGEEIRVKISLINSSHKSVKHVKVTVQQSAQVNLFSTGKWKVCVASTNNR